MGRRPLRKRFIYRVAKKGVSALQMARKAFGYARWLRTMLNVEKKKHDAQVNTTIGTTGNVQILSGIAQGDGIGNREGNSIKVNSLYLRGALTIHGSATASICRIMLVRDKQQIGDTEPALSDVLQSVDHTSPLNSATVGRFKIMWDKTYVLKQTTNTTIFFKKYFKLARSRLHCRFNAGAATDLQKNHLYLMIVTSEATNLPAVVIDSRLGFIDN